MIKSKNSNPEKQTFKRIVRVLVVDDSTLVCQILKDRLSQEPGLEVVGTAPDPYAARDMIVKLRPDVMTLDVEMPRMSGLDFLKRLMPQYPIPVIMVSSLTKKGTIIAIEALEAGAVDFVTKPSAESFHGMENMMMELCTKIKIASTANVSHWKKKFFQLPSEQRIMPAKEFKKAGERVIAIGASTGGIEAITEIVTKFPPLTPGVVIVQHMPPVFTAMFADRLNSKSSMFVKEAEDGDLIKPGQVLVAPGDKHLHIEKLGKSTRVKITNGDKVCGHRPSVEVMMQSMAKHVGANGIGIMLSGMGSDGANAMLSMRNAGARTIAQNESTSVVFGMPKEAYKCGGAERLMPLKKIANEVIKLLS
jgi:two-component system chemotaxis response regulator CheB